MVQDIPRGILFAAIWAPSTVVVEVVAVLGTVAVKKEHM